MIYKFLLMFLLFVFQVPTQAIYVEKLMGKASPEYRRSYFDRMWKWYGEEFYDFSKKMSQNEKDLINLWKKNIDSWGVQIDKNFYKNNFTFSHKVNGEEVNSSLLYIGHSKWSVQELELIKKIINEKGIKPHDLTQLLGVGWNFEEEIFSLYLISKASKSLNILSFKSGKLLNLIVVARTEDFELPLPNKDKTNVNAAMKVTIDNKLSHYHFRFKGFFVPFLSKPAGVINIKHFQEFRQPMASMELIDTENYTVHYP